VQKINPDLFCIPLVISNKIFSTNKEIKITATEITKKRFSKIDSSLLIISKNFFLSKEPIEKKGY
jgi:hypothetical protein